MRTNGRIPLYSCPHIFERLITNMNIIGITNAFRKSTNFATDGEVSLFRALAKAIVSNSNSVFIDETHGSVAQVEFQSLVKGTEQCEIADLLIVVKNQQANQYRATFWQAKKESHPRWPGPRGRANFDFEAQFNQWELLSQRPVIKGLANFSPDPNILRLANSPSIGSFGVFYENNGDVDVNYSVAEMVSSSSVSKKPRMVINELLSSYCAWDAEVLVRHDLKSFLEALNSFQIGSYIDPRKASDK